MSLMIKKFLRYEFISASLVIVSLAITAVAVTIPAEQTLGNVIKIIFVHAVFAQAGLITFIAAGFIAIVSILKKKNDLYGWMTSTQITAVLIWTIYYLTSMIATYYAWRMFITWEEPRVQMTLWIFAFAVVFLAISIWIRHIYFSAILNIFLTGIVLYLSLTTVNIRHPGNPIGDSGSVIYMILFYVMLFLVVLFAIQLNRLINRKIVTKLKISKS
jgi:hypothetical protein